MTKPSAKWTTKSYIIKKFEKLQQPVWGDEKKLKSIKKQLKNMPPLVFSGEIENLRNELKEVECGNRFILHGGCCAESFEDSTGTNIRDDLNVLTKMSFLINSLGEKRVLKIGRIAGQFAKPRSSTYETIDGKQIYSYRGDMVNNFEANEQARIPNPEKMLKGYFYSASTLNLLRGFAEGGYESLKSVYKWPLKLPKQIQIKIDNIQKAFHMFMDTNKMNGRYLDSRYFTSHEALLLDYEEVMIRKSSLIKKDGWYGCSAHLLWIGERTRSLNSAHIELLRGIENPIGIKIGPKAVPSDVIKIIKTLNKENESGKILLIIRMGSKNIKKSLTPIIKAVQKEKLNVIWITDPMHENTFKKGNHKTRDVCEIKKEITLFFDICMKNSTIPSGVHLEMTGKDVYECIDSKNSKKKLGEKYDTLCDPRLNTEQSISVALHIADLLKR